MKITAELLYHFISEKYTVYRYGRGFRGSELSLPVFYERGTLLEYGKVYIARSQDLPPHCRTECVFLCIGNRPTPIWNNSQGELFYIAERELNIFYLFNFVIDFFDKITRWDRKMKELLDSRADIDEFVRVSIPIFQNSITITDYNLRILVDCIDIDVSGQRKIVISKQYSRIPDDVSQPFMDIFKKSILKREPFFYKGQIEDSNGDNYCINMYLGDSYIGTCSIRNRLHPIYESDCLLFQHFADYIRRLLSTQPHSPLNQLVTVKNIFADLLQSFPVSREDSHWAMDLLHKTMELHNIHFDSWQCIVIRSINKNKTLPSGYLCTALENLIPHCSALTYDDLLVCYRVIPQEEHNTEDNLCDILNPYLKDMNFCSCISTPFQDIFKAREHYLQAKVMLETGCRYLPQQYIYQFQEVIPFYMLQQCSGEFDSEMLLSPGLLQLKNLENGVDYWNTLRLYLDNECNASKTAQELHLHRSSLLPRLEKIKTMVDFDTPIQRLYLRMCMARFDMENLPSNNI